MFSSSSEPTTPIASSTPSQLSSSMVNKCHQSVLNTIKSQTEAIAHLQQQYATDLFSIDNLITSIITLYQTHSRGGKIVITGIGKSHKLASKLVATLNSLCIQATSLHPSEALHGDLGLINESKDCLIMLTASGNTPELINLLPHLSPDLPILLLTCNKFSTLSISNRIHSLLLAELPNSHNEVAIHGLPAPTVSTTLSLILADSVILALSEAIESDLIKRKKLFGSKHPGGSIGASLNSEAGSSLTSDGSATSLLSLKNAQHQDKESNLKLAPEANKEGGVKSTPLTSVTISKSSSISFDGQGLEMYAASKSHPRPEIANTSPTSTSTQAQTQAQAHVKYISHDEIIKIEETMLLKWITLYDSLQIKHTDLKVNIMQVRQLYRQVCNEDVADQETGSNWSKFKWELLRSFK
ncbi:hypothetical protein KGF57_002401 [Candida theae]|uniref:SIS domain-containing protein n=1 Tax=Candida theae TaxID=1198502 RepID=A0AAD5FYY4_9ASCO|nr:uncharacterized protein KGF57_002401 [Candida theae]KAI5958556.1 hypothetical protein KGF57_002401 [Candida theae]